MNILVDSVFTPLTYSDFMAPVKDYMTEYKEKEETYANLIEMTEAWKDKANLEKNPIAYGMYKDYSDRLKIMSDDFSQGMNTFNRRDYLSLKRGYALNIKPIERADEERLKKQSFRREVLSKDPTVFFKENDGEELSIDPFLNGGEGPSDDMYSGTTLEKEVADGITKITRSLINKMVTEDAVKNEYFDFKTITGLPYDLMLAVLEDRIESSDYSDEVKNQLRLVLSFYSELKSRFNEWSPSAYDKAVRSINRGMLYGLEEIQHNLQKNPAGERAFEASERAKDRASAEKIEGMRLAGEDRRLQRAFDHADSVSSSSSSSSEVDTIPTLPIVVNYKYDSYDWHFLHDYKPSEGALLVYKDMPGVATKKDDIYTLPKGFIYASPDEIKTIDGGAGFVERVKKSGSIDHYDLYYCTKGYKGYKTPIFAAIPRTTAKKPGEKVNLNAH